MDAPSSSNNGGGGSVYFPRPYGAGLVNVGCAPNSGPYTVTMLGRITGSFEVRNDDYILDAAEEAGYNLPYSDRAGSSSSSAAVLLQGVIDNSAQSYLSDDQMHFGFFLTDTAYACSNITIITDAEECLHTGFQYETPRESWETIRRCVDSLH